ncbi:hypothetical protein SASPL_108706 [Salvia splendens]|uniref:Uncharacterized protein n=1 Tax=Salvia splendens TaxID=180675 RepID=A0A8X9A8G3_SALSN|nr:hypothetical protein SASPL_108706 [Salvia splendens]
MDGDIFDISSELISCTIMAMFFDRGSESATIKDIDQTTDEGDREEIAAQENGSDRCDDEDPVHADDELSDELPRPHSKESTGLCYYCPEKYTGEHVCNRKFYALIGVDDDEEVPDFFEYELKEAEYESMVITGDVSRIHVISPSIRPRAIRLKGQINGYVVSVLIDGGSTHNFIKPVVAEKLSLPVHEISPFRVFVGNGGSLRCSFACLQTPISLQGTSFDIDLFILQVKGPDVILGIQWLQELGDVTKNYRNLTMRFDWGDKQVFLQGDGVVPRQISYNNLFSLMDHEPECELFELVASTPDSATADLTSPQSPVAQELPEGFRRGCPIDTPIRAVGERTALHEGIPQCQWGSESATIKDIDQATDEGDREEIAAQENKSDDATTKIPCTQMTS